MKNVLDIIAAFFPKVVNDHKITEAFIFNGELNITSVWELSNEQYAEMEKIALGYD